MKKKNNLKFFYNWHRRLGVVLGIPTLFFALTGLILNHSKFLKLDQIYITNSYVVSWYGMLPKSEPVTIKNKDLWVTKLEDVLYVGKTRIANGVTNPTGISVFDNEIAVSTEDAIYLLDVTTKELLEKLDRTSIPSGKIISSASRGESYLIDTTVGQFVSKKGFEKFEREEREAISSPLYSELPAEIYGSILEDWRGRGLSLWRVILDLHSGASLGLIGQIIVNFSSVFIIFLVFSGLYTWSKKPPIK